MKKYKVIKENTINIDGIKREPGDIFEADNKSKEIKILLLNKYIQEIKQ